MKCQAVQNRILALLDPRHIPSAFLEHVGDCAACRVWVEQVARLESLIECLPVPPAPTDKKASLIAELTGASVAEPLATPSRARPMSSPFRTFIRENANLVGGLAAAILVAFGVWAFSGSTKGPKADVAATTPEDPFLKKVAGRTVALAKATTPTARLQALSGWADDLGTESRSMARVASPDELQEIARWFGKVKDGMVKQAETLPPRALTPAERLTQFDALAAKMGDTVTQTNKALEEVSQDAKPALERIRDTAQDGQQKLRDLARKGV